MIHETEFFSLSNFDSYFTSNYDRIFTSAGGAFLDIETTGFSRKASFITVVGILIVKKKIGHFHQFFLESPGEEPLFLQALADLLSNITCLIHYNGDSFDLPFLLEKARFYQIDLFFSKKTSIDLYKGLGPLKRLFSLPTSKLFYMQAFLGYTRSDHSSGSDVVDYYRNYIKYRDRSWADKILLHNRDDVLGLLPLMRLYPLLQKPYPLTAPSLLLKDDQAILQMALTSEKKESEENLPEGAPMSGSLPSLPLHLSGQKSGIGFLLQDQSLQFQFSIRKTRLRRFFPDYKNYYYLPAEDEAIHKSVGQFVDPPMRQAAKAATCYQNIEGSFLPLFDPDIALPSFRKEYSTKEYFTRVLDVTVSDENLLLYGLHLWSYLLS